MNPPLLPSAGESDPEGDVGYSSVAYAKSLAAHGEPVHLSRSGAWMLKRAIPGTNHHDARGCYPLLVCSNWSGLAADLDSVGEELVSLVAVVDPLGEHDEAYLRRCFPDLVRPTKSISSPICDSLAKARCQATTRDMFARRSGEWWSNAVRIQCCLPPSGLLCMRHLSSVIK